jgi:hypothetical protein
MGATALLLVLLGLLAPQIQAFCEPTHAGSMLLRQGLYKQQRLPPMRALVDVRQVSPDVQKERWPSAEFNTPRDLPHAVKTFFDHTTPKLIGGSLIILAALRCASSPLNVDDILVAPAVCAFWVSTAKKETMFVLLALYALLFSLTLIVACIQPIYSDTAYILALYYYCHACCCDAIISTVTHSMMHWICAFVHFITSCRLFKSGPCISICCMTLMALPKTYT